MNAPLELNQQLIQRTQIGVMTYLAPKKSFDEPHMQNALTDAIEKCIGLLQVNIVLDLASIALVNSAAMEGMLDAQDRLLRLGGWLKIANASKLSKEVFRITNFSDSIAIIDNEGVLEELVHQSGPAMKLGDILLEKGLITLAQLEEAIEEQKSSGKKLGEVLIDSELASEPEVYLALGQQLQVPFVRLKMGLFDATVSKCIDRAISQRLGVLPLFRVRDVLYLATSNPQDVPAISEIEDRIGVRVAPILASPADINKHLVEAFDGSGFADNIVVDLEEGFEVVETGGANDYDAIDELAAGSPVINLVNSVIQRAVRDGASDVHIEPGRAKSRVRYRIDGVLYEAIAPSVEMHPAIVSRLKVMANLDIAERRMPQDGRIQVQTQGRQVDLRFSSLPGLHGEKVVLRVLDKNQAILDIDKLGMKPNNVSKFRELLTRSYGLVLVTGPTGSGKTTSLYAALNHLNSIEKNIVTIEDPVEYQLDIINQNEVRAGIDLSFAKMLKHILRQDPDIVMIGEIRDRETAEIAVQAALTGHLVLSTLHTNDSIGAITRMIDMGVEPYLLSSALLGVVAQRLLRTICPSCKTKFVAPPHVCEQYGFDLNSPVQLARGRGCNDCYDSGYRGRAGIHEILEVTPELQGLIMNNPSRDQLNAYLDDHAVDTLMNNGLDLVLEKETTLEEVARVVNS